MAESGVNGRSVGVQKSIDVGGLVVGLWGDCIAHVGGRRKRERDAMGTEGGVGVEMRGRVKGDGCNRLGLGVPHARLWVVGGGAGVGAVPVPPVVGEAKERCGQSRI